MKPRIRLAYLDGLRAVAASYVVGFHAVIGFVELEGPWRVLKRAFAFGHEAVAVFIVLSGYCLMLPVARAERSQMKVELAAFVGRRAFRILPPYYATLAGSLALLAAIPALRAPMPGTIWQDSLPGLETWAIASHLVLVHNWFHSLAYQINGPLWSVASEWQIYFFFPLLLLPLWRAFGAGAALAAAAILGYLPLWLAPSAAGSAIPWYLLAFALGMLAARVSFSPESSIERWRLGVRWSRWSLALWGACAVGGVVLAPLWFRYKPVADTCISLATASLLVWLTQQVASGGPGRLLSLLESKALVGLGHFSYSLYLTHLPLLALLHLALGPLALPAAIHALLLLFVGGALSLIAAYAFHVAVERRFIRR